MSGEPEFLDRKIQATWRDLARVALGTAMEIGVLALVFESTFALKSATVIIAFLGLGVLQFEAKIRAIRPRLFIEVISILSGIYICFAGYAIAHAYNEIQIRGQIEKIYLSAAVLLDRPMPVKADGSDYEAGIVDQFIIDAKKWHEDTARWLTENVGPAARERFYDVSNLGSLCWGPKSMVCDLRYSSAMNRLVLEKRNLFAIIESYGK